MNETLKPIIEHPPKIWTPEEKLELFIEWCHKGPPAARVENVEINWQEGERQFQDFRITD